MNSPNDDELRADFEALRQEDDVRAPDFRAVLSRPQAIDAPRRRRLHPLWIAAAAGVLLAVGIAFREAQHGTFGPPAQATSSLDGDITSLTKWRSPTASLLRTSGSAALSAPRILSSILDGASHAAVQR